MRRRFVRLPRRPREREGREGRRHARARGTRLLAPARTPGDAGRGVPVELVVLEAVPEVIVPAVLALEDVDLGPNVVQQLQKALRARLHRRATPRLDDFSLGSPQDQVSRGLPIWVRASAPMRFGLPRSLGGIWGPFEHFSPSVGAARAPSRPRERPRGGYHVQNRSWPRLGNGSLRYSGGILWAARPRKNI